MPTTYAIPDGRTVMAATLYTGTGAGLTISNAVNGVSFQPDFVWIKVRSTTYNNNLYDSVRGTSMLASNLANAENPSGSPGDLTTYNAGGFSIQQTANYELSHSGATYVAWQWKAGTTSASNTNGSITSTVSANTTAGFSVVQFTATGSNATVGHGLGVAPAMVIVKDAASAGNWAMYHQSLPSAAYYLYMNTTAAQGNASNIWNSTAPTSTVFSVGTWHTADRQIAYCFAAVAGYSAFGSYTGNGSTDGTFVYLGFRPRFILIKSSAGTTGNWVIWDSSRNTYNATGNILQPNTSNAELSPYNIDLLSNGFKIRDTDTTWNGNTYTYIYACFAENPLKYANAR